MIGREKETEELKKLYLSKKAELVAIYGRRRIGKTYLINQFFNNDFAFKHTGLSLEDNNDNSKKEKQLNWFYNSLLNYGLSKNYEKPKDWFQAFILLQKLLTFKENGKKLVVFIDEIPWLDTKKSDFIHAFEGFWNNYGCANNNLLLIICGSANSWIFSSLINKNSGLYGRVTYEIKLNPFTLNECEMFYKDKNVRISRYDIVQSYMIFGGIPYYLNYINPRISFAKNIDEIIFKNNSILSLEFDRLFTFVFDNPEKTKEIVKLLATNKVGYTRSDILLKLNLTDGGTFSKYINSLIASDFVIKYKPFGFKKSEERYKLVDHFCLFYLNFIYNKNYSENYWSENITSQKLSTWRGNTFENVCFNHINQIKSKLGIIGVSTECSQFYNKDDGYQIDLVIDRKDNVINLCEMKYYSSEFVVDKKYYLNILNRSNLLREKINSKKKAIINVLITSFGLKINEYSDVFNDVITIDDLFAF